MSERISKPAGIPQEAWDAAVAALSQEDWTLEGAYPNRDAAVYHEPGDIQISHMLVAPIARAIAAGRIAGLREAAEVVRKFDEVALKCDRCGDIRSSYEPGGCSGEAEYRASAEFKNAAFLDGDYYAMRYFEKHLCRPRQMEHEEMIRALSAAIDTLAASNDTP